MKHPILAIVCALMAFALQPQVASAGPVSVVAHKTANLAHRAAYRINRHVIQPTERHVIKPAQRAIVNHTPGPR